jgi:hypothetical protein
MLVAKMFGVLMICEFIPCLRLSSWTSLQLLTCVSSLPLMGAHCWIDGATIAAVYMYNFASSIPLRPASFFRWG